MKLAVYSYRRATDAEPPRRRARWNTTTDGTRIGAYVVAGDRVIALLWGARAARFNQRRRERRAAR